MAVAADALGDLPVPPGNRLEKLKGDRAGSYSIRVNRQWRICFRWSVAGAEDVENTHYQANGVGFSAMSGLRPGIESTHEFEVTGELLTDVGGTLGFSVLSTPGMIAEIERTAAMLVYPLLEQGKATVGFEVCVKHVGAAREGSRCLAHVRLEEVIEQRKLRFAVEVKADDGRTIGIGSHERRVIEPGRAAKTDRQPHDLPRRQGR